MTAEIARGDGVGIEVAATVVRGARLRRDARGRLSSAAELPLDLADDRAALDTMTLLHAELGSPSEPTRVATFGNDSMMQRIDITGRSGPELNELRATLDQRHSMNSSVVVDDGPRRWLLVIRWDAEATRRIEDLAERAGFCDVTVEPSPMALARATGIDTTYARRLVTQGDSHHIVVSNRIPVAALSVSTIGRAHPDVDVSTTPVTLEHFDDLLTEAELAVAVDRVMNRAFADDSIPAPALDLAGEMYPPFPEHDLRSAQRQAVALGAALGAAGLVGQRQVVDVLLSRSEPGAPSFDHPWAVEAVTSLPEVTPDETTGGVRKLTRYLRPRGRR